MMMMMMPGICTWPHGGPCDGLPRHHDMCVCLRLPPRPPLRPPRHALLYAVCCMLHAACAAAAAAIRLTIAAAACLRACRCSPYYTVLVREAPAERAEAFAALLR
jgi:hypothetical protein